MTSTGRQQGDKAIVIMIDIQTTESRLVEWHKASMTFK